MPAGSFLLQGDRTLRPGPGIGMQAAGMADPGGYAGQGFALPANTPRITVEVYDTANTTLVGTLTTRFDVEWQDPLSEPGAGRISIPAADPGAATASPVRVNPATEAGYCTLGRHIRFSHDGVPRHTITIEESEARVVARDEEYGQGWTFSGRGILAEWERAVVYPPNGTGKPYADTRYFNFAASNFDDSSWAPAIEVGAVVDFLEEAYHPPDGWPDPFAQWVWTRAFAIAQPVGVCYFRRTFTAPSDLTLSIYCTADDGFDLWLDGVPLMSGEPDPGESWRNTYLAGCRVTSGEHVIAFRVENYDRPHPFNIAGLACSVFALDENAGDFGVSDFILHTGAQPPATPYPGSFLGLDYPSASPGFTCGRIISTLLAEAQTRGSLTGWSLHFSDTTDSDGTAWPTLEEVAFRVGDNYLTVLRQLSEFACDLWCDPVGRNLYAYVKDGQGSDVSATVQFDAAVNIGELTVRKTAG